MDAELLKQLTRIADALEAQNVTLDKSNTINEEWARTNKQWRDENIQRRERETNLAQREQEYEHIDALTREFIEKHPEIVNVLMEHQIQIEQAQGENQD